jgi:hypothetical protein
MSSRSRLKCSVVPLAVEDRWTIGLLVAEPENPSLAHGLLVAEPEDRWTIGLLVAESENPSLAHGLLVAEPEDRWAIGRLVAEAENSRSQRLVETDEVWKICPVDKGHHKTARFLLYCSSFLLITSVDGGVKLTRLRPLRYTSSSVITVSYIIIFHLFNCELGVA